MTPLPWILSKLLQLKHLSKLSEKKPLIAQLLRETKGKILHLFDLQKKASLCVNKASVDFKRLTPNQSSVTLDELIDCHDQIKGYHGVGSTKLKQLKLNEIFGGLSVDQSTLLKEYYQCNQFRVGFSRLNWINYLSTQYPDRKEFSIKAKETGLSLYDYYLCLVNGEDKSGLTVKPMLATSRKITHNSYWAQIKLDGVRLMMRKIKGVVRCWTRAGHFLDADKLRGCLDPYHQKRLDELSEDYIIDGELCVNSKSSSEGFRMLLPVIKSKVVPKGLKVKYYAFDILYWKTSLLDKPYEYRRGILESINIPHTKRIRLPSNYDNLLSKIKDSSYQGLVLKQYNSLYECDKRSINWVKLKPLHDTLDLLVGRAYQGNGKNKGLYSSFDLYAKDNDQLVFVGQVGSGFTQDELKKITLSYDNNEPQIIEVRAEAYHDALRFCRFVRFRPDKIQPNTMEDVKRVFS